MRGVTITCFRHGPGEWDAPVMAQTVQDVQSLGANAFSFHPYARISADGGLRFPEGPELSHVVKPLADAKRLGAKVMLIPHIAYWGSGFSWRGEIVFHDEPAWQRFFSDYERFIVAQAAMAQAGGADVFCVGIEYQKTLHREQQWRQVIAAVRKVYRGKLVYAANWNEYEQVPFWDALDYVGVQAYFPLINDGERATDAVIEASWDRLLQRLRGFAQKQDKPLLMTELGYPTAAHAAREPWLPPGRRQAWTDADEQLKLRCMRIALAKVDSADWIHGVFLWKWFPTVTREIRWDFGLQYPEMRTMIRERWGRVGVEQ